MADSLTDAVMHPCSVRLNYRDFDNTITDKYRVVVDGWPLGQFRCPSEVTSRVELETLLYALESGSLTFTKLTPQQLERCRQEAAQRDLQHGLRPQHPDQPLPDDTLGITPISAPTATANSPVVNAAQRSDFTPAAASVYPDALNPAPLSSAPTTIVFRANSGQERKHKVCSDKGQKHGLNKRTTGKSANTTRRHAQAADAVTAVTPTPAASAAASSVASTSAAASSAPMPPPANAIPQ